MANLNKVFLIGNLTRDPEMRYSANGTPVASFGLAINRSYTTQSGERKEETCFVRVVVFGKHAESCNQYLKKGRLVFVEGRLQYRSWEHEGQKRSTLDVVADRVQFLSAPRAQEGAEATSYEGREPPAEAAEPALEEGAASPQPAVNEKKPASEDDLPF